jgi:hypothetical protein
MTLPSGVIPIDCFTFDAGPGWMNTGKPNGYHDTGWYWLPEDGGGRGLFGQAQGSSEFWVVFDYDATGKPSWRSATVTGLSTDATQPLFGGAATQYQAACGINQHADPNSSSANPFGYALVPWSGGPALTGPYKQATSGAPTGYASFSCDPVHQDAYSTAGFSTLNGAEFSGPSTALGGTQVILDGTTDRDPLWDPVQAKLLQSTTSTAAEQGNSALCASTGGDCKWVRLQF